eukprot:scaffold199829_cov22-Prasinocladus_malaysianus.AAC.1
MDEDILRALAKGVDGEHLYRYFRSVAETIATRRDAKYDINWFSNYLREFETASGNWNSYRMMEQIVEHGVPLISMMEDSPNLQNQEDFLTAVKALFKAMTTAMSHFPSV